MEGKDLELDDNLQDFLTDWKTELRTGRLSHLMSVSVLGLRQGILQMGGNPWGSGNLSTT